MMLSRLLLALLLTTTVLAGCLGPDEPDTPGASTTARPITPVDQRAELTESVYEILGHYEHSFSGSTGTELYVDYYLPDVPDDVKAPVILVFTPYQTPDPDEVAPGVTGDVLDKSMWAYNSRLVNDFVPRGYAVAFADVRGNHQAGGCIDQSGPEQWQDGYDYVEWLGGQEWSNGNVGMWGVSYDGETQFTTAMTAPPSLKTIVPIASVSNQYDWNFFEGVPYEGQPLSGMSLYFALSAVPSADPTDATMWPEKVTCQQQQFENGLDFSGDWNTFWIDRDYRPMAGDIEASVLHVHGLADWNVRPIHIDPLFNDITSETRGVFGQWGHANPNRDDWGFILHAWYDYWLMELDNGILDILPPVLIEGDDDQWHGIDDFPPRTQDWLTLQLSADKTLVPPGENATEGSFQIHDVPEEGTLGTSTGAAGVVTTATGDATAVAFEWTTDQDLQVVGRPEVHFAAETDTTSTHWAALLHVLEPGAVTYVVDEYGVALGEQDYWKWQNSAFQDTRHLAGLDKPADLTPGERYELHMSMYPQWDVIPAGSTIRLTLTNNDDDITQDATNAVNTVHVGGETMARLMLPLAPVGHELPENELPDVYPGYGAP